MAICSPESYQSIIQPWLHEQDMKAVVVGPVERWLSEEVPHFPYNKTFGEAEWSPLVVLHTSGSSGIPKPIVCRQGMLAIGDAYRDLPDWQGTQPWIRKFSESERMLNPSVLPLVPGLIYFGIRD